MLTDFYLQGWITIISLQKKGAGAESNMEDTDTGSHTGTSRVGKKSHDRPYICCGSILSLVQILFSFLFGYCNV